MNQTKTITSDVLKPAMHGFFTRAGGYSEGVYQGLNLGLGSDDDRETVLRNRQLVCDAIGVGPDNLVMLYQVHSADAVCVNDPWPMEGRPKVDGFATSNPDLAIGILTADCGPVLFSDAENEVVGACHAGWKGATGGVMESTIARMEELGAKRQNIIAVLGPTISQENYEVGPEFTENLVSLNKHNEQYLTQSDNADHAMFDLPGYIVDRLENVGVKASWTGQCTYADEGAFYSYRRMTHRGEADYGRQISVIRPLFSH